MANLSNINGKFAVEDTGAIKFNNLTGTNNQVLIANTNSSPTWVDVSTIIGGPYLPLTGGTLAGAGNLVVGGILTVNGVTTLNAALTGATASFTGTVAANQVLINSGEKLSWGTQGAVSIEGSTGSNQMEFRTNSTDVMIIDSSGNVGIGTDDPDSYNLGSTGKTLAINSTSASVGSLLNMETAGAKRGYLFANSSNVVLSAVHTGIPLIFNTEDTTALTIDSNQNSTFAGNVNISSPGDLYINSGTSYNNKGSIFMSNQRTEIVSDIVNLTANGDTSLNFKTRSGGATASALFIDEFRNVGIGTDSPDAKLEISDAANDNLRIGTRGGNINIFSVNDSGATAPLRLEASDFQFINGNSTFAGTVSATKLVSLNGVLELDDNGTHNGIINVPASLRINIDSDNQSTGESFQIGKNQTNIDNNNILFKVEENGNVGIGTTPNSYSNQTVLTINGSSIGRLDLESGGTLRSYLFSQAANTTLSVDSGFFTIDVGGSERMRIESDGTIRAKTGSIVVDTAGQGIYLGGTAVANNLNYYASGTWTPTVTTSQLTSPTITSSSGRWQRVGKVVTASFEFTMSNPTVGAGTVIISNLPIAIADTDHVSGCGVIGDLGKTINVRHYTATNQIGMNFYDGNYCGTAFRTVGTVTYWAAT